MTGQEINNLTLTISTETLLTFASPQQNMDIINYGPGVIFLSWRKTAVVDDANCLQLAVNGTYEVRATGPFTNLSIIGASASVVQVVTR